MKILSVLKNILKEEKLFADTVDAPKYGLEQHRKRICLKGAISKGKVLGVKSNGIMKELIN